MEDFFLRIMMLGVIFPACLCGPYEVKLLNYLRIQRDTMKLERPAEVDSEPLDVQLGINLQQIVEVDEKNQLITSLIWLTIVWTDYKMKWIPADYGNISVIRIPVEEAWRPDILLYNSADVSFDSSHPTNLVVDHDGTVSQLPPGMFKSSCSINIKWFPFDDQFCELKFGSWTYDGSMVNLLFLEGKAEGNTDEFKPNGEWNLMGVQGIRNVITYACCPNTPYIDLTYTVHIRRRKLYYMVNIMAPCMMLSLLSAVTFLIPPDAGEKISFCVTILLSLTVLMMIVSETLPPTSDAIPLIAIYFSLAMVITAASVMTTIWVLNYQFRTGETHELPHWVKHYINNWMAWIFRVRRPGERITAKRLLQNKKVKDDIEQMNTENSRSLLANVKNEDDFYSSYILSRSQRDVHNGNGVRVGGIRSSPGSQHNIFNVSTSTNASASVAAASALAGYELKAILRELKFITKGKMEAAASHKVADEWKFAARVVDRMLIWVFIFINIAATVTILLGAPNFLE